MFRVQPNVICMCTYSGWTLKLNNNIMPLNHWNILSILHTLLLSTLPIGLCERQIGDAINRSTRVHFHWSYYTLWECWHVEKLNVQTKPLTMLNEHNIGYRGCTWYIVHHYQFQKFKGLNFLEQNVIVNYVKNKRVVSLNLVPSFIYLSTVNDLRCKYTQHMCISSVHCALFTVHSHRFIL